MTVLFEVSAPVQSASGLCFPWADPSDILACDDTVDIYADADSLERFLMVASDLLFQLSGQQFPGSCETVLRPCSRRCGPESSSRPTFGWGATGGSPWPGCFCSDSDQYCSCKHIHQVELGVYPIIEIIEVLVDGAVVPADEYRVDANRYLVRIPDSNDYNPGWPLCQDLNLDATEEGTFQVEFSYGRTPPDSGVLAAAVLAKEFFLACNPSGGSAGCRLPRNISSIARQGVSVIFERLTRTGGHFRFGLWEVDTFLEAYAPYGPHAASMIASPDTLPLARRVNT